MKKILIRLSNIVAFILVIYQFVSWVGMGIIYKEGSEHPMSDIGGFIVDDNENIIIEEGFYSVIQVFDKNGTFVTSWSRDARNPELKLGKENTIIVESAQTKYYQLDGKEIKDKEFEISKNNELNRKNYRLIGGFSPRIFKTENDKEKTIVQQSFFMNLTKAPFPFFGLGALIFFIFGLLGTIEKIKESK